MFCSQLSWIRRSDLQILTGKLKSIACTALHWVSFPSGQVYVHVGPALSGHPLGQFRGLVIADQLSAEEGCRHLWMSSKSVALHDYWSIVSPLARININCRTTNGLVCLFAGRHNAQNQFVHPAERSRYANGQWQTTFHWHATNLLVTFLFVFHCSWQWARPELWRVPRSIWAVAPRSTWRAWFETLPSRPTTSSGTTTVR